LPHGLGHDAVDVIATGLREPGRCLAAEAVTEDGSLVESYEGLPRDLMPGPVWVRPVIVDGDVVWRWRYAGEDPACEECAGHGRRWWFGAGGEPGVAAPLTCLMCGGSGRRCESDPALLLTDLLDRAGEA
jgi:hypothetical protein